MTDAPEPSGHSVQTHTRQIVVAGVASCFGAGLDLFDLFILLYVAPVIGKLFFPAHTPMISLAAAYAAFAVTLLMRPLGSALFGNYADQHGRKGAMRFAMVGVGVTTALFGALPTVGQIGVLSSALFVVLRLVQGIFVGGVNASTHTVGTESVPARWRGLMSGLVGGGGSGVGALLASLVFMIATSLFPGHAFTTWGWRFMFFCGIFSSVFGLALFHVMEESPLWAQLQKSGAIKLKGKAKRVPLKALLSREHLPVFSVNILMTFSAGACYYLTAGYLPTFFKLVNHIAPTPESRILVGVSIVGALSSLLVGAMSEAIGRRRVFLIVGALRIVFAPLTLIEMARTRDVVTVAACSVVLAVLGIAGNAPLLIFLNERFPTAIRATGTAVSWNIGYGLGGMMPMFVSLFASGPHDIPRVLVLFLLGVSLLYFLTSVAIPETKGNLDVLSVAPLLPHDTTFTRGAIPTPATLAGHLESN